MAGRGERDQASYDGLLAAVDDAFADTGASFPGWPPPRPIGDQPLEEEYSRVTDPGRYRILAARVEAWERVLQREGIATVDAADIEGWRWWLPTRESAVPLRVRVGEGGSGIVMVTVAVGVDQVPEGFLPDCGCDACDTGSEQELLALDELLMSVMPGGVLAVTEGARSVLRRWNGWSSTGTFERGEQDRWLSGDHPPDAVVVAGEPWLGRFPRD